MTTTQTGRRTYVYRLEVTYPEGGPQRTEDEREDREAQNLWVDGWPAVKRYLTRTGAERRAALLMKLGATVAIHRSEPVVWSQP